MKPTSDPPVVSPYEPRRPTLLAFGFVTLWIAILSLPMLAGKFLGNPHNDQLIAGYAFRMWGAEQWRATGSVPLWNPHLFGGLPFVAAMHGDIFYPTAWARLIFSTATVMNLEFPVHYILAGLFLYMLLRLFKTSWAGSVTGALTYQLSGVIISYVAPGHDGKLFVTALLPLVLIGLVRGIRDRKLEGYAIVALGVGLALVSPQAQMTFYLLIAAGLFALYLTFGEKDGRSNQEKGIGLALSLAAVLLGFGIGMIQLLPFYHYLPFSPRAAEITGGFDAATSYAIPWPHVPEFFVSGFAGRSEDANYWGPNGLKLHSEYLGLPALALMLVGLRSQGRRRLVLWLGGIGLLFLLVGMGSATPFYQIWWSLMPYVKKTRAPGMALYVVSMIIAMLAAFGVERLEKGEGRKAAPIWMAVGIAVAVLGFGGLFGAMAESLARGVAGTGMNPEAVQAAAAALPGIRMGALWSGIGLVAAGFVVWLVARDRLQLKLFALLLPLVIGADLWRAGQPFWMYVDSPQRTIYGPDSVTAYLKTQPQPFRVLDLRGYNGSVLMGLNVSQLIGYHSNELRAYDDLLGRSQGFRNAFNGRIWDLLAVRYIIAAQGTGFPDSIPGFHRRFTNVATSAGALVNLFEADAANVPPYARLVTAAAKAPEEQAVQALNDPRYDYGGLVILDSTAALDPPAITTMPQALPVKATVTSWAPGKMTVQLQPAAPQAAYVLVAENWYPDWTATVDGQRAPVYRGDVSLITVPVPAGAKEIKLSFVSKDYPQGKMITLVSVFLAVLGLVIPPVLRRRASQGG